MLKYMEIYNSIISEFQLSGATLEKMRETVEDFTKCRMDICKFLKISKFKAEVLDANKAEFIREVSINKDNIKYYERKQIELKGKIKINKQEIKTIKFYINKLEGKLMEEQQEGRKLRETLGIFISRERFKFIKNLFLKKYRKVFLKYSNELSIKAKITECDKRKGEIRLEIQNFSNSIDRHNRKIIINKIALAEMRKSIINAQKRIDFLIIKIQSLEDYKEMEKKFRLEYEQC